MTRKGESFVDSDYGTRLLNNDCDCNTFIVKCLLRVEKRWISSDQIFYRTFIPL